MYTIYANAEGFMMIHILNVCENAILMYLIPILVRVYFIYDGIVCSKIPFKGFRTHSGSERGPESYKI